MRTAAWRFSFPAITFLLLTLVPAPTIPAAQIVTNWVAYNDHRPGPLPKTNAWGTALGVTPYDMRVGPGGNLTNFVNKQQLPVTLAVSPNGAPDDFGQTGPPYPPNLGTPAAGLFFGVVDVGNTNSAIGVRYNMDTWVTLTFSGLNPDKHYVFRGTSARGGGYALRWTVATLIGAQSWIDAHLNGNGPGVLTSNNFPADLGPGQAAYNSGDNFPGAVVGWDFISPAPDGTFSVQSSNYVGHVSSTVLADNTRYGYAIAAFLLAEVEAAAPVILTNPPAQTTLEENRPLNLSVAAAGTPLFYQWFKQGVGPISGATLPTYSVARAALGDAGDYFVRVYNPLGSATSTVAHLTVNRDVTGPSIAQAFSYPSFDFNSQDATLDQVIVEFNEALGASSASDPSHYVLHCPSCPPAGSSATSAVLTNDQTVALTFSSPLTEDSAYSLQVSGVLDLAGNNISSGGTNNPAAFQTWMRGPGNGLLFEAFATGGGVTVDLLTNSPVYPDSPFLRTNLWAFDSRVVFDDAAPDLANGSGTRTRGVFIPPVSGNWVFFLRTFDRGNVYFNPNGLDPAGSQQILAEVTGNNPRDWDKFISAAFTLKAGHGYYLEALQKADAGTATKVIKVAARLAGTGFPPLGIPDATLDTNALMGAAVASPLAPRDLGGPLTIVGQLANVTAEDTHFTTFSFLVSNPTGLPVLYKWFRDGNEIPGVNGPTYRFQASLADDGAHFSAQASKIGAFLTSATATLTVVPDTNKPTVIAVVSQSQLDKIIVTFSEPVNPLIAVDPFDYQITGFGTTSAVPDASGSNVVLTLDAALMAGATYTINISTVEDLAQNVIVQTNVTFRAAEPPRLAITRSANAVRLSWPLATPTAIQLYSTPTLTGNPPPWTLVDPTTYLSNPTSYFIDVSPPTGTMFYYLKGQP